MIRKLLQKGTVYLLIPVLFSCLVNTVSAQVTVTSSGGTGSQVYPYLSTAFAAINNGTHTDSIVIELSASITDTGVSLLNSSGSGAAFYRYVMVRPKVDGITLSYTSSTGRGVIELNGADTVIIDGDNPYTPGVNKNLTITNTASATETFTSVIRVAASTAAFYNTAYGITIKNLILNGSATGRNLASATSATGSENTTFGIIVGPNGGIPVTPVTSVTTSVATTVRMDTFTVSGCSITSSARAIAFNGSSSANAAFVTISNNLIGNPAVLSGSYPYSAPSSTVYSCGISVKGTTGLNINNNTISNILSYLATGTSGIELVGSFGSGPIRVFDNTINGVVLNNSSSNPVNGILVSGASGAYTLRGNSITNIMNSGNSVSNQPSGIRTAVTGGSVVPIIESNKISRVYNYNTGTFGANGIFLQAGNNDTIRNNVIWDINQDISATSTVLNVTNGVYGIRIGSGTSNGSGHCIYHNTVHLSGTHIGTQTNANKSSFAFCLTTNTQTNTDIRNNIFSNTMTGGGSGTVHAAIFLPSGATSANTIKIDNNIYYSGTNKTIQAIAQVGTTAGSGAYYASDFKRAGTASPLDLRVYSSTLNTSGTNDLQSFAFTSPAPFVSGNDLHLITGSRTSAESGGAPLLASKDIDNDTRPGPAVPVYGGSSAPDIGADEGDFITDSIGIGIIKGTQFTDQTAPGVLNQRIHRITIPTSGSTFNPALTSLLLNTAGTINPSDINAVKIYYTGNDSNFSNSNLFGTTVFPFGSFYVTGNQKISSGTNYLWITYDIAGTAITGNTLDVRVDSLVIGGANFASADPNPSGSVAIVPPMTYISSSVFQADSSRIMAGASDNQIIGIRIITSSSGIPAQLTQLNLSTNGTTNLSAIANAKIWYTGAGKTFSATNQFGNTVTSPGISFTVNGIQKLLPDTNYFWVTYSIPSTGAIGAIVDAECTSFVLGGITQTLTIPGALGSRLIRADYCTVTNTSGNSNCISNVSFNSLNYTTTCTGGYNNYTTTGGTATTIVKKSGRYNLSVTIGGTSNSGVWIDWNDDGSFTASEFTLIGSGTGTFTVPITVPCESVTGSVRMRVRAVTSTTSLAGGSACLSFSNSESEDYQISINDSPATYIYSSAVQQSGTVAPTRNNREILRVPIVTHGCGTAILSRLDFTTSGTTNTSGLVQATLFSTGTSSVFNAYTAKQVSTVAFPAGPFSFFVNDTLVNNDTTNYWLTYDLNSATIGNVFDATLNQVEVSGVTRIPSVSNPAGNVIVQAAMTYMGSEVFQKDTSKVVQGSSDNVILGLRVITSSTGAPMVLNQLNFDATGTTDTSDIRNIKVYFTGKDSTFRNTTMFGNTLGRLPGGGYAKGFSIQGNSPLLNDTNYFWLTYDIAPAASLNNFMNASISNIIVEGAPNIPSVPYPIGRRQIRAEYCIPGASNTSPCTISSFTAINSVATTGGITNINNLTSGCNTTYYNYYPSQVLTVKQNETVQITLANISAGTDAAKVWIDYNQDGLFTNEEISLAASGADFTGKITIPCNAATGLTRMRVRNARNATAATLTSCATLGTTLAAGETEDYVVNILAASSTTYTSSTAIQQKTTAIPGALNVPILRIPVKITGCQGSFTARDFRFSTSGSTNNSDILMAKLYRTGNNPVFNTSKPVDSVYAPVGQFSFMATDSLENNDTTNYWLVYDIAASASTANVLDAIFDSVFIDNQYRKPTISNPSGAVSLPVKLMMFNAYKDQSNVLLLWTTAGEQNNKGFEAERSVDGRSFTQTGKFIEGAGNSSVAISYNFTDTKPFEATNSAILYYRLKQVDFDGTASFSNIIKVAQQSDNVNALSVYPNPFNANYDILFSAKQEGTVTIQMMDFQGKTVLEQKASTRSGLNKVAIAEMHNLRAGMYFVKVTFEGESQIVKLVKD
jgi:hypothetical protein